MEITDASRQPGYPGASMTTIARRLDVYVANHCLNCADALAPAEEAAARFSDVVVRVIDLDLEQEPPPDNVVAVPTYVLDGRTISLGNPDQEELFARLHEAVE